MKHELAISHLKSQVSKEKRLLSLMVPGRFPEAEAVKKDTIKQLERSIKKLEA